MKSIKLILLLSLISIAGCGPVAADAVDNSKFKVKGGGSVRVVKDYDRGVTCWVYNAVRAGGISCIPNNQLNKGDL